MFSHCLLTQHPQVVNDHTTKKVCGVLKGQLQPVHLHSRNGEGVAYAIPRPSEDQVPHTPDQAGYLKGVGVLRVEVHNLTEGVPTL